LTPVFTYAIFIKSRHKLNKNANLEEVYNEEYSQDSFETNSERRLGKRRRSKAAPEYSQEDLFELLKYLDESIEGFADLAENSKEEEFENWNKWFKKKKQQPPKADPGQVFYVREEYNAKRSPHMWKSNPNRRWILAFGNNPINNVVATNLYKYQNETISKDA